MGLHRRRPGQEQGVKIVVLQQNLRRDLQGLGDLPQDGHRRVGLPPLDLPQHAAGHPGEDRRLLQAQLLALADAADVAGDGAVQFHGKALPKRRKAQYLVKILSYHSLSGRNCQGGKGDFSAASGVGTQAAPARRLAGAALAFREDQLRFQTAPSLLSTISMPWAFSSSRMRSASAKFLAFLASYRARTSASMAGSPSPVMV